MKIYIGTLGFIFDCGDGIADTDVGIEDNDTNEMDSFKNYQNMMNSVTLKLTLSTSTEWIDKLLEHKGYNFKYIIYSPNELTSSPIKKIKEIWNNFWDKASRFDRKGSLGCLVFIFDSKFICKGSNIKKLDILKKLVPEHVKKSFEFRHWTWWESKQAKEYFEKNSLVKTIPYLENRMVNHGWAGNMPSAGTKSMISPSSLALNLKDDTKYIHISLNGTMGPYIGSYDVYDSGAKGGNFLKDLSDALLQIERKGVDVFVSFNNNNSTYCYPLPPVFVCGIMCHPKLNELPDYGKDYPCCIHDAFKLNDYVKKNRKYKLCKDGNIEISIF